MGSWLTELKTEQAKARAGQEADGGTPTRADARKADPETGAAVGKAKAPGGKDK